MGFLEHVKIIEHCSYILYLTFCFTEVCSFASDAQGYIDLWVPT